MPTSSSLIGVVAAVLVLEGFAVAQTERPPAATTSQAQERFSVAAIAPSGSTDTQRAPMGLPGGLFEMQNMPVRALVAFAFRVRSDEITGLPGWATTDRYTIRAKSEIERPSSEQLRRMVQDLLRTRFQLVSYEEQRPVEVWTLTPARSDRRLGPRLVTRSLPCERGVPLTATGMPQASGRQLPCPGFLTGPGWLYAVGIGSAALAELLSNTALNGSRVVDRTQLEGVFDVSLEFSPLSMAGSTPDLSGPAPLLTAVQDQLGLKLEPVRELSTVLVIDRLDRPTEN